VPRVNRETLAVELHEISPAHGDWYPWRKLSFEAQEGWVLQAERLLRTYDITPKEVGASAIVPGPEPAPKQVPSVGRMVHYVSYAFADGEIPEHRAAIITEAWGSFEKVRLCVMSPTGMFFNQDVEHDEDGAQGTWHWPER
jgi:hypothetical protein